MEFGNSESQRLGELEFMAHLFRRAGFGATHDELTAKVAQGYEAVVEELVHPETVAPLEEDIVFRYHAGIKESRLARPAQAYWLYRMINTRRPLEEKMTLFWHCLFATAFSKLNYAKPIVNQIAMLRRHCLGNYRTLLIEISRDPAMIFWLDNQQNTKDVHNENYGRELLELFTMGVGNYTEDDVKSCARAFTGWGMRETIPGDLPYGRFEWEFEFRPDLHDYGDKVFLGEHGTFDGSDIIDIILRQPAAAQFLARKLLKFFVFDRPDEMAVSELAEVCQRSSYDMRTVMRVLLLSDVFRSRQAYYAKVKSPVELVVGVLRLTGDFQTLKYGIDDVSLTCGYMGQELLDPPTVEGWHTGLEWINTASLMERINFSAKQVGDTNKPGVKRIIHYLRQQGELPPKTFVEKTLELIGPMRVSDSTMSALVQFAAKGGNLLFGPARDALANQRVVDLLQLIVATREFQLT